MEKYGNFGLQGDKEIAVPDEEAMEPPLAAAWFLRCTSAQTESTNHWYARGVSVPHWSLSGTQSPPRKIESRLINLRVYLKDLCRSSTAA